MYQRWAASPQTCAQPIAACFATCRCEKELDISRLPDGKICMHTSTPWAIQYYNDMQDLFSIDDGIELGREMRDDMLLVFRDAGTAERFGSIDASQLRRKNVTVAIPPWNYARDDEIEDTDWHTCFPFVCDHLNEDGAICGARFRSARALNPHVRLVHGHRHWLNKLIVTNQCPWCRTILKDRGSIVRHCKGAVIRQRGCNAESNRRIHELVVPFAILCPQCDTEFETLAELQAHVITHAELHPPSITIRFKDEQSTVAPLERVQRGRTERSDGGRQPRTWDHQGPGVQGRPRNPTREAKSDGQPARRQRGLQTSQGSNESAIRRIGRRRSNSPRRRAQPRTQPVALPQQRTPSAEERAQGQGGIGGDSSSHGETDTPQRPNPQTSHCGMLVHNGAPSRTLGLASGPRSWAEILRDRQEESQRARSRAPPSSCGTRTLRSAIENLRAADGRSRDTHPSGNCAERSSSRGRGIIPGPLSSRQMLPQEGGSRERENRIRVVPFQAHPNVQREGRFVSQLRHGQPDVPHSRVSTLRGRSPQSGSRTQGQPGTPTPEIPQ